MTDTDIENICVVGTGIPQSITLIILSETELKKTKEEITKSILASIAAINPMPEQHERLEKVMVMKETWSMENGLLTPILKLKPNQVEKIHQQFYLTWFSKKEKVIWE